MSHFTLIKFTTYNHNLNFIMNNDINLNPLNQPSRNDLLQWINSIAKTNYSKVQQLGTGIAYCQILDTIQSNKLTISKVNLKAKSEYEFINNFKLIQQCFSKMGIYKNIQIQKLVKCKYQDNLEFLQWFHKYFEGQFSKNDALNNSISRYEHRSLPKKSPSPLIPHNISKIERRVVEKGIENGSFEEVLEDLGKTNNQESFQQRNDFFKAKIFEIQELVDCWDPNTESKQLKEKICQILMIQSPTEMLNEITSKNIEI